MQISKVLIISAVVLAACTSTKKSAETAKANEAAAPVAAAATLSPALAKAAETRYPGVAHDDIMEGEKLYNGKCGNCHGLPALTEKKTNTGKLEIELLDKKGAATLRIMLDSTGSILTKQGYRNKSLGKYNAGETVNFKIELNTATRFYTVSINGEKPNNNLCFAPVASVERIVFRTGSVRRFPDADTPTDQDYDLLNADAKTKEAVYFIHSVKTN